MEIQPISFINSDHACRVCQQPSGSLWTGILIGHSVDYYECPSCGYVQTESPYWLEQAYSSAINDSDTGIMKRNLYNRRIILGALHLLGETSSAVLDYAGGYGILVRLLRDDGVDAFWYDKFCKNLVAKGFEYTDKKVQLVTAFEAFEHFDQPMQELEQMLAIAPNVLLSTELIKTPTPAHKDWWYYGKEHGQHIGFFREQTLKNMAKTLGKHVVTDGKSFHLFSEQPISNRSWKLMLKLNKLYYFRLKQKLTSKTQSDFLNLSGQ